MQPCEERATLESPIEMGMVSIRQNSPTCSAIPHNLRSDEYNRSYTRGFEHDGSMEQLASCIDTLRGLKKIYPKGPLESPHSRIPPGKCSSRAASFLRWERHVRKRQLQKGRHGPDRTFTYDWLQVTARQKNSEATCEGFIELELATSRLLHYSL